MGTDRSLEIQVDGKAVRVASGGTILAACDAAGRYVPRLCYYPGFDCLANAVAGELACPPFRECGLCVVRLGDGSEVLACAAAVVEGMQITTDDAGLKVLRLERLADVLSRHPHICLSCPDRDGCARDECSYGIPLEARCCDRLGSCEFGVVVRWLDGLSTVARKAVVVARDAFVEGRIRREPGLCIGCGRCVRVCEGSPESGEVLEMTPAGTAVPKKGSLRASGCTFCGRCVLVCPAGALTAPGDAGARWLARRQEQNGLLVPVLPPDERRRFAADAVATVPPSAGVFRLFDEEGEVVRITGMDDVRCGLAAALADPGCATAVTFDVELDALFTQRESELLAQYAKSKGRLPPGNDLGDELFDDE